MACALAMLAIGLMTVAGSKRLFRIAPLAVETETDAELYTGTIQLAPSRANRCRRITFDNRSGELQDRGTVACGYSLEADAEPPRPRNLDLVREGFRNR